MVLFLTTIIYLCVHAVVQGRDTPWLPCKFSDERTVKENDGVPEIKFFTRDVILQFGEKGDAPLNPHGITFLVTGSKLKLQKYIKSVEPDRVECMLYRHMLQNVTMRWPVQQDNDYNNWFSCTIKHTNGDFELTSFLRQPTDQLPSAPRPISDKEVITTAAAMMIKTNTPLVKSNLGDQKTLHCQFATDHKGPKFNLEWHKRGERTKLFSYTSHTKQIEGGGVDRNRLSHGDASYNLAFTKISNKGMYVCSVTVSPLFGSLDIGLHIEESPRVSLSVGPTLTLQEGEEHKVVCEAERYYPLDVTMTWYKQDSVRGQAGSSLLPTKIPNTLLSSHRHNSDKTYTLLSYFYLRASLSDSGKEFTCKVSHKSLRMDIKKSFILTVEEPSSWFFFSSVLVLIVIFLVVLFVMCSTLHKGNRRTAQKKPY